MNRSGMNRRRFLETSGQAAAGAASWSAGGAVAITPSMAPAATERQLDAERRRRDPAARRCASSIPHDSLADQYYAAVVAALDRTPRPAAETEWLLKDGVAGLDEAYRHAVRPSCPRATSCACSRAIQDTPFFQTVRGKAIVGPLQQPAGLAGRSATRARRSTQGGYIERGFDDLGWLPAPPEAEPAGRAVGEGSHGAVYDLPTIRSSWSSVRAPAAARSPTSSARRASTVVLPRGRQARDARGLRQRRVGLVPAARPGSTSARLGQLAGRQGLPEPAGLGLQDRRRHDRRTGPAPRCASRPHEFRVKTEYGGVAGRQPARLADRATRTGALLRQGRGQARA